MKRTCLVTKVKAHPDALLRFTVQKGHLIFDQQVKAEGRGGYVVKDAEVLQKLSKLAGKIAYFLKVKKVAISDEEIKKALNRIVTIK